MKAISVNPYAVLVRWSPPEFFNAAGVRYSVFWYTKYDNGSDEMKENLPWRQVDTSVTLQGLLPFHNYTIWVNKYNIILWKLSIFKNLRILHFIRFFFAGEDVSSIDRRIDTSNWIFQ